MSAPPPSNPIARHAPPPLLAAALAMLCFAGSMIVVRATAGVVAPAGLSVLRCILATALLLPICLPSVRHQWPLIRRHLGIVALLAALLFIGGNGMMFVGLQFTTAINAGLINSAEPVAIVAVAWLLYRDRMSTVQWSGVAVSTLGVLYLVSRGSPGTFVALDLNAGDLCILVSIVSWAFYAVLLRRVPPEIDRLSLVLGIIVAGGVLLTPFWILEHVYVQPTVLSWDLGYAVVYNAVFPSIFATFWWNHAVQHLGPPRAGPFIHLIPVYTVILAVSFLGEALLTFHLIGIALVGVGIYLTTIYRQAKREKTA